MKRCEVDCLSVRQYFRIEGLFDLPLVEAFCWSSWLLDPEPGGLDLKKGCGEGEKSCKKVPRKRKRRRSDFPLQPDRFELDSFLRIHVYSPSHKLHMPLQILILEKEYLNLSTLKWSWPTTISLASSHNTGTRTRRCLTKSPLFLLNIPRQILILNPSTNKIIRMRWATRKPILLIKSQIVLQQKPQSSSEVRSIRLHTKGRKFSITTRQIWIWVEVFHLRELTCGLSLREFHDVALGWSNESIYLS